MNSVIRCLVPLFILIPLLGAAQNGGIGNQDLGVPSTTGLVVSTSAPASDAGAAILQGGGNAVDAAVATAFALAVTHPSAGNIGGGGFMIVRDVSGKAFAFDYREKAPLRSKPDMYLDEHHKIHRRLTDEGYLAPGVPGTVRGLELAHRRLGKLAWKTVLSPAIRLAESGFVLSRSLADDLNRQLRGAMGKYPASVEAYGKPGGAPWAEGDHIILKDLARTLAAIANEGSDVFYKGWIADRIDADMKANGGLITKEDLATYQAKERKPLYGTFRGYQIISMPPPSSGGVGLIEMLNILEHFDLKGQSPYTPGTLHLTLEAMRRAYLDRARFLGDPDFGGIPVRKLTSKRYAKTLASMINPARAASSLQLGRDIVTAVQDPESEETTHFSVIDKNGMAVANTFTLEGAYGSRVVVKGTGFLLNNEMRDFNQKPGETNTSGDIGTKANLIVPGKRMLSSMTPTIVTRNGKVVLITGSPGGRTIINTVLNVVLGVVEYGMNGRQAVDSPRLHHQWLPDVAVFEHDAIPRDVQEKLREAGHNIRLQGKQGDAHSIFVDPVSGVSYGVSDKRSPDGKASK